MDASFADIIILALIAGFIALRLRAMLGRNSGLDPRDIIKKQQERLKETVIRVQSREAKPENSPVPGTGDNIAGGKELGQVAEAAKPTLDAIRAADPAFTSSGFLGGARTAFEWVFDAFAKGDKEKLKLLMSDTVFSLFSQEIDRSRATPDRRMEATLVSIVSQDIANAQLAANIARISVRFVSEQIHLMRDTKGAIVEGNPSAVQTVSDIWVFERDVTSRSPNWKIVDT